MSKAIFSKQYRLMSMPKAQCRVYLKRLDDGSVSLELISCETSVLIANYTPGVGGVLYCSGTYSVTTARHINRFTRELFGENIFYACKSAVYDSTKLFAFGWYYVCDVEPELLLKMCKRYEEDARGYYGRY